MNHLFTESLEERKVKCLLCPRQCILQQGHTGYCRVRKNVEGEIVNETYRLYSGVSFDPIEKKPLYHFYPGSTILSVGSVGCNLRCQWCQNCDISQTGVEGSRQLVQLTPEELLKMAFRNQQNIGIAYTYNEPTINFESIVETGILFRQNGLKNVFVTNGYTSHGALQEYLTFADAFNVDIKAFNNDVHLKYTGAKLDPILSNLVTIKKSGCHLELTFLLVPEVNDDAEIFSSIINWITEELGSSTVLHISRYFPRYKYTKDATSPDILKNFYDIAREKLNFVYVGNYNLTGSENTFCPSCSETLIIRKGYYSSLVQGNNGGICKKCNTKVFIDK